CSTNSLTACVASRRPRSPSLRAVGDELRSNSTCRLGETPDGKMKRILCAAAALLALFLGAHASDDRLPTKFVRDWCFAEHTADHLTFYRRGRCADPDQGEWLTIRPDSFDVHEMHCKVLIARANKRGDLLAKFRCNDNLIQNY